MKEQKLLLILSQSLIGTGFFFLYVQHVRSIFESRTNIAYLTQLERESLLRREDSLYYSFYKTLTEEADFWSGYDKLTNLTGIEHPQNVNVIQRFHVLPELAIGYLYHLLRRYAFTENFPIFSCWRSNDVRLPLEHRHCDGIGQPMQFYLECVWLLGGVTVLVIYIYGTLLSENIFGGIYAVVSYVMFHSFASKIYESPMARENFAFPIIFMQMFYLCLCIDRITERKAYHKRLFITIKLTLLTALALLCWQFSSVIFATQILIMMAPWTPSSISEVVSSTFTIDYAISQLIATSLAYYCSFSNKKYIFAWHIGPAIGLLFLSIERQVKPQTPNSGISFKTIWAGLLAAISVQGTLYDMLERTGFARSIDNGFALYRDLIVQWGFQAKVSFSTSLAACNPAYQNLNIGHLWELIKTLIVKPYCMYGVVMLAKFFRKWRKGSEKKNPSKDNVERAKKYVLEDFLEENHISMGDMSNKETENDLNECLKLLKDCNYDYNRYKQEKTKSKNNKVIEHEEFMNNIKLLKEQIKEGTRNISKINHSENSEKQEEELTDGNVKPSISEDKATIKSDSIPAAPNVEINDSENDTNNDTFTDSSGMPSGIKSGDGNKNTRRTRLKSSDCEASKADYHSDITGFHYVYSFVQMAVFTALGLSIKKLFFLCFTQGCVIAPTICSKFWYRKQRNIFWAVSLAVFLTSMVNPGLVNIREEYFPTRPGHASDDLDSMLEWIKINTERDAVFAGPVEIIGTVHLVTRRPIVNHAHLEIRHIHERTEHVYSVFSRQQSSDIYNQYSQLKVQYLIISLQDCSNEIRDECDLLSIWDDLQPSNRKYPQFCSELANKNIPSFLKVFSNDYYGIIKMFSQSVQINLKLSKMPEKVM
ncbi:C-mannosyltransferase dpy-19 homolog isoform X1 [Bactrocera neohumeralis]|uniref:C-mannosyltransferase dpy-19 homolog isoform X1 n=1 Tax=Bactrocera neohumeralis TaxID=98809 RepID=UPI002166650B|nr:C-mannosyltransferase dpy-19 homolog isoform X1 [Bactrocera neohumeralis]